MVYCKKCCCWLCSAKMNTQETRDILSANETEAVHLLSVLMHYNILLSVHNHYSLLCCQPEPEKYSETRKCWNFIFETDNNSTDFILGDSFIFSPWLYSFNILWQCYIFARGLGTVSKISEMPTLPGLGTGDLRGVLRFRHQSALPLISGTWRPRSLTTSSVQCPV